MKRGKATQSIHGNRDKEFRSVNYPIFQTTSFGVTKSDDYNRFINDDEDFFIYTRYRNPTIKNVEQKLAKLENAESAVVFSSGMAAISSTIMSFVKNGDVIAAANRLYGMTFRFLRDYATKYGISIKFLSEEELYRVNTTVPDAKLVYFETPINPTTECISITRIVEAAKQIDAKTIIDNTFASPINQNPIDFGVDIVVHSATKYLGGHSDIMAGAAIGSKKDIKQIHSTLKAFGGCINPIDAYLLDRSLKTLKARVENQNSNAYKLAKFFEKEEKIEKVFYPGLKSSPSYEIAKSQMSGFGAIIAIELESLESAKILCDNLNVVLNATSLGSVETLVSIPLLTSHIKLNETELKEAGVISGMVRVSVGLEDIDDLIEDFKQALAKI